MAKYMVSENEIRQPDTPLGRAKKWSCAGARARRGRHCLLFGCSVQTVRQRPYWMQQAVQAAVEPGTVTVQARQLVD
jgi:ParB family chromosome partitioning protein